MPTIEKENYLKALYKFDERGEGVTVTALSRLFGVSKSTVSNMLKEMSKLGLVETQAYKPIFLTEAGRQIATEIVAKHRLIETFLVQVMGFEPDHVHQIAEELELPPVKVHCSILAEDAIKAAVNDYRAKHNAKEGA